MKKISYLFYFIGLIVLKSNAQNYSFGQFFYPNVTLTARHYEKVPIIKNGPASFEHNRTGGSAIVPLRSEVQVGIGFRKKLDFRAVHTALIAQFTNNSVTREFDTPRDFKTVSLGIIQMQASIRDRLWVYGGGLGFTEDKATFFNPSPFIWGGAARMHVLGLNSQILYGTAMVFNQKLKVIPIFGINQKLGKKWRIEGILPFQLCVSNKLNSWLTAEGQANIRGYSGGYKAEINTVNVGYKQNLSQVDLGMGLNAHIAKLFNIGLEAGYSNRIKFTIYDAAYQPSPVAIDPQNGFYVGANIRYLTSKSKLSSKFLNRVGIGL